MKLTVIISVIGLSLLTGCTESNQTVDTLETYLDTAIVPNAGVLAEEKETPPNKDLTDGTYYAQEASYSTSTGYKSFVTVNVLNQEIVDIEFNAIFDNANQTLKEASSENTDMTHMPIHEQLTLMETHLMDQPITNQPTLSPNILEQLTLDSTPFLTTYAQALAQEPIPLGEYQDGYYMAEANDFSNQQKPILYLTVKNGHIIAVSWDIQLENSDQTAKQLIAAGDSTYTHWYEQTLKLEQYLLEIQDPSLITYDEDNVTPVLAEPCSFIHDFVALITDALAAGPIIK